MNKMRYIYVVLITVMSISLYAQDAHLSQFDVLSVKLNPAETGMFQNADFRAGTQYRNQWGSMSAKYSTSVLAYDMPIGKSGAAQSRWGVGGYMINDDAAKAYNVFSFVVGGAYQITTPNDKYLISVGLQAGMIYKNIKDDKLIFDNQWNDGAFDTDMPTGENFDNDYKIMPEVVLGVYYKGIDKTKKVNPYAGLSFFHITNPTESFMGMKEARLPIRYQLNVGTKYKINDKVTLDPGVFAQYQRNVYEINAGLRGFYRFNDILKLNAGGYYRIDDAVIILLGLSYKNIDFNMSYDINTSELNQYTDGKGGFEFSLVFTGSVKQVFNSLL